jgi:hypothetical protein
MGCVDGRRRGGSHRQHPRAAVARRGGEPRHGLSSNLLVLAFVSLTRGAASEMLHPLLLRLLTGVLAATPVLLGVIEGVADATARVSRYVGERALVGAATARPVVLVARVVDRVGKRVRGASRDAPLPASVATDARGRAFGLHRAGESLGAVIALVVAEAMP